MEQVLTNIIIYQDSLIPLVLSGLVLFIVISNRQEEFAKAQMDDGVAFAFCAKYILVTGVFCAVLKYLGA